jgi:hypothetical protein
MSHEVGKQLLGVCRNEHLVNILKMWDRPNGELHDPVMALLFMASLKLKPANSSKQKTGSMKFKNKELTVSS